MNVEEWMEKALVSISTMKTGEEFSVKDLFRGVEWNALETGDRLLFGRCFKNKAQRGLIERVKYMGKRTNNSAWYMIQ